MALFSVLLLDSYAVPPYAEPGQPRHVIRSLSTHPNELKVERFSPPNLISSPSAAVLSIASVRSVKSQKSTATALLLPGMHIPPPPNLGPVLREEWDVSLPEEIVGYAFVAMSLPSYRECGVQNHTGVARHSTPTRQRGKLSGTVGE